MARIDRRVARTRAALQRAHFTLILEKGYEATTVEDICSLANVGRSTFYAHFADKDDLKRSGLEILRQELMAHQATASEAAGASAPPLAFSLPMLNHARAHLDLYRALVSGRGGAMALDAIRQILADVVRAELAAAKAPTPRELTVQYVVGAFMAVLTWWLDDGARTPPEEIDAVFRRLATQGLPL